MPVTCPYCQKHFPNSNIVASRHKVICEGWVANEVATHPLPCLCGHESTSRTQMKRHTSHCEVWASRDKKEVRKTRLVATFQGKYGVGVTSPMHLEETRARIKKTCLEKYGAENVFSSESAIYEQVRKASKDSAKPLYGKDNPFSKPEVQEKIRSSNLERYGVENPNQSPIVRSRTRQTNLERYGVSEVLASPAIRSKITATNQQRYGGNSPGNSPEVVERTRQTNQSVWGFDWTCQHPDVRQKQINTMFSNYGTWYLSSPVGIEHTKKVLLERYGVEHPLQSSEIYQRYVETSMQRYGFPHAMQNEVVLRRALDCARKGPNIIESKLSSMCPHLRYTGNGDFWVWFPTLRRFKNPDFVVPGLGASYKKGVSKVVELFGDYWHSPTFTGMSELEHGV